MNYQRRRYRDDPDFRLRKVNYNRARLGLPPVESVDEINRDYGAFARRRERNERGRFT